MQQQLDGLSGSCSSINHVLVTTKQTTAPLISDMERLQKDLDGVEHKGQLINDFLEQYQLAPEEVRRFTGPASEAADCRQLCT